MKLFLLLAICCTFSLPVLSQNDGPNDGVVYKYYDKNWNQLPFKDGAAYVRVFTGLDVIRTRYEVNEYTIRGVLLRQMGSSSRHYLIPEGPCTWYNKKQQPLKKGQYKRGIPTGQWTEYYNNGQMKEQYTYAQLKGDSIPDPLVFTLDNSWDSTGLPEVVNGNGFYQQRDDTTGIVLSKGTIKNGQKDGLWLGFHKNGLKDYEEEYADGEFVKGTRFDNDGTSAAYDHLMEAPVFPGGDKGRGKFLQRQSGIPLLQWKMDMTAPSL
ncbi:hypothetical protein [uncultured Chitinophaga sp.]|jgi:Uncharacterized protein conserved in bacteria|uniref:toxin-antitoxin system YwqK family antitoxin n=1 Tax=uncultured Chitinophaga sp. TaxID=339340 RepID=UPI0026078402|nr:hypothetical protein [uncultured Chitinophaga sp.]